MVLKVCSAVACRFLIAAGAVALLFVPTASWARVKAPSVVVLTVRYDDLNLTTPDGVRELHARVRGVADRLCLDPGAGSDDQRRAEAECKLALLKEADAKIAELAAPSGKDGSGGFTLARGR